LAPNWAGPDWRLEAWKSTSPVVRMLLIACSEAGVAASTVSRALNNPRRVNPATREHILSVAERLEVIAERRFSHYCDLIATPPF
jgi:hypothetical protein